MSQFAPQSLPPMDAGPESKEMGMTEPQDNAALERKEIAIRVANFKATQQRFERERDEFFAATLGNARLSENPRHSPERPPFWP